PLGRRSSSSTQPISTTRLPFFHSRPVVSVSRMIWRIVPSLPRRGPRLLGRGARDRVHALVVRVAIVALDPAPLDLVALAGRVQALPQVAVLDRVAAGGLPAAAHPAGHPLGDALAHVLRIGE